MLVNVGTADRVFRIAAGLVLILLPLVTSFALWDSRLAAFGLPLIGAVLVLTAIFRFCPLYRLIGLRTCRA